MVTTALRAAQECTARTETMPLRARFVQSDILSSGKAVCRARNACLEDSKRTYYKRGAISALPESFARTKMRLRPVLRALQASRSPKMERRRALRVLRENTSRFRHRWHAIRVHPGAFFRRKKMVQPARYALRVAIRPNGRRQLASNASPVAFGV